MRLQIQEEQKKKLTKKNLTQNNPTEKLIQKNPLGNKNLFLKGKKIIQPMAEPNKSFNKNK